MPARRREQRSRAARPRTSSGRSCAGPTHRSGRGSPSSRGRRAGGRGPGRAAPTSGGRRRDGGAPTGRTCRGRRSGGSTPAPRIASAASRPVSSAWPMPSPVITSLAIAASPVSSTRPPASGARSMRAGIGHALCRSSSVASGPRARRTWGRSRRSAHCCFMSWIRRVAVAQHAEAEVDAAAGQRERPRVPGQEVGLEPDVEVVARRSGDAAAVLPEGVPLAEVAGRGEAGGLADRAPHPVGGDDVAGADRTSAGDADDDVVGALDEFAVEPRSRDDGDTGLARRSRRARRRAGSGGRRRRRSPARAAAAR